MSSFLVIPLVAALTSMSAQAQDAGNVWFRSAAAGNTQRLKAMLAEGVSVDLRGAGGQTALMMAASEGHGEAVTLLVSAGADTEARDEDGVTALMNAAGMGHAAVVRILLEARADPNAGARGGIGPLLAAAVGGPHREILMALLDSGADLEGLLSHRNHPESAVRVRIVMALAMLGSGAKRAVPELAEALTDENLNVRYWAASALKGLGPDASAAVPRLIDALKTHPDGSPKLEGPFRYYADVRWITADALGEIGVPSAVPALREALNDENPDVRDAVRTALAKLESPSKR